MRLRLKTNPDKSWRHIDLELVTDGGEKIERIRSLNLFLDYNGIPQLTVTVYDPEFEVDLDVASADVDIQKVTE